MPDAVVIGAGPNGLVAANNLADRGWSVVVLEAQGEPGGAVRSGELTLPGFRHDLFSAFYPLAELSPALRSLALAGRGGQGARRGFRHVLFSAFYPLAELSPALRSLGLEDHGLAWRRAPLALAHPTPDGGCAVIGPTLDRTADSVDGYCPGDGDVWRRLMAPFEHH